MSQKKKRYLHRKLAVSVFWTALLFSIVIAIAAFFAEYKRTQERNLVMLNQLLDTMENTAAVAAYSGNQVLGQDVLRGLLRNDIVHEARLRAAPQMDLRESREGASQAKTKLARTLRSPFGEGETVGSLVLIPDTRLSLDEARHSAWLIALGSAAVIGLTALMLLFLFRLSLSRPLMQVSNRLHIIKAGEAERLEALPHHDDDELGQLVNDINSLLDTTQQKFEEERRLLRQIQAVEQQLRDIFESTSAGIFLLDEAGRLQTANPTLGRVLGLGEAGESAMLGKDFAELAFALPEEFHALLRQTGEQGHGITADLQLRGAPHAWAHCLLSRRINGRGGIHYEGVVYDITERRAAELRTRHEADHDPLTGLRRRQAVERDLGRLLETQPGSESRHIVMLLDLDNFKGINDSYGHAAGDTVLIETAKRLRTSVRTSDWVARLGGDEFAIVLVDCHSPERPKEIARKLVATVLKPIPLGPGVEGRVGVSIGMAVYGDERLGVEELFKAADLAMYEVKRQGKNGFGWIGAAGTVEVQRTVDGQWV